MSQIIGLGGFSGSGKSSSLKYLNPSETFIISCTPKQLAIPGFRKNYKKLSQDADKNYVGNWYFSNDFARVSNIMSVVDKKLLNVKTLIIDDANYLLSQEIMSRSSEKGYDKHIDFAKKYYDLVMKAMTLREDLVVVFISHIINAGSDYDPEYRLFTSGNMLNRTVNLDGLFNYLLYAEKIKNTDESVDYKFRTHSLGNDTCRSTDGCFSELYIDNNMQLVIDTINKFELGE